MIVVSYVNCALVLKRTSDSVAMTSSSAVLVAATCTVVPVGAGGIVTVPTFGKVIVKGALVGTGVTGVEVPTTATGALNIVGKKVTDGSSDMEGVREGTDDTEGNRDSEGEFDGWAEMEGTWDMEGSLDTVGVLDGASEERVGPRVADGNIEGEGVGSGEAVGDTLGEGLVEGFSEFETVGDDVGYGEGAGETVGEVEGAGEAVGGAVGITRVGDGEGAGDSVGVPDGNEVEGL